MNTELIDKLLFVEKFELISEVLRINKELETNNHKHLIVRTQDFESYLNLKQELETTKELLGESVKHVEWLNESAELHADDVFEWLGKARKYLSKLEK